MISHSWRGGRWSLTTGWAATTRTKAKRLFTFFPAGVSRQVIVFQARPGSRCASASSDSGSRSGRATERGRPVFACRSGTAKVVSGPNTVGQVVTGDDAVHRDQVPAGAPVEVGVRHHAGGDVVDRSAVTTVLHRLDRDGLPVRSDEPVRPGL